MAERTYRISISGRGGEFAFSKSSLEEFEYWNSEESRVILEEDNQDGDPLFDYILCKDYEDDTRFEPVKFKREGEWFEQDDIDHTCGTNVDYAYITVEEMVDGEPVATLFDNVEFYDFMNNNDLEIEYEEAIYEGCSHVLACVSIEKGTFFEGYITTNEDGFDARKLGFKTKDYITEDELIEWVYYDGVQIDGECVDTIGKGMYVEIHRV